MKKFVSSILVSSMLLGLTQPVFANVENSGEGIETTYVELVDETDYISSDVVEETPLAELVEVEITSEPSLEMTPVAELAPEIEETPLSTDGTETTDIIEEGWRALERLRGRIAYVEALDPADFFRDHHNLFYERWANLQAELPVAVSAVDWFYDILTGSSISLQPSHISLVNHRYAMLNLYLSRLDRRLLRVVFVDRGEMISQSDIFFHHQLLLNPNVSREGYTLDGWYFEYPLGSFTRWNFNNPVTQVVTQDVRLYARWTPVTVDNEGGNQEEIPVPPITDGGTNQEVTPLPPVTDGGANQEVTPLPPVTDGGANQEVTPLPPVTDDGTNQEVTPLPPVTDGEINQEVTPVPPITDGGANQEVTPVPPVTDGGTNQEETPAPPATEESGNQEETGTTNNASNQNQAQGGRLPQTNEHATGLPMFIGGLVIIGGVFFLVDTKKRKKELN